MSFILSPQGAEVNVRDHCGWTPLHEACNHGYMEVVQVLLDHGAMIDDPGGTHCGGVTPLMDGAINGHVDIVSLLIERGTDINIRNSNVRGRVCYLFTCMCMVGG